MVILPTLLKEVFPRNFGGFVLMFSLIWKNKVPAWFGLTLLCTFFVSDSVVSKIKAQTKVEKKSNFGLVRGFVRDEQGNAIANAAVAVFRVGTSKLLKQVYSSSDGSFSAKILSGTYTILAVAQGFNPITVAQVQVDKAADLNYGFKLERNGSGRTLPERRSDRDNAKWRIRAANSRRSIYQALETAKKVDESEVREDTVAENADERTPRKSKTVVETYFANNGKENYRGLNVATQQSLNSKTDLIVAVQTGANKNAPQRVETTVKFRPNDKHKLNLITSVAKIAKIDNRSLAQFSAQATDEWQIREGVIVVFGVDYSNFIGAGNDFVVSPRIGFQADVNAKTRVKGAYTTQTEEKTWAKAIELEDAQILFRQPLTTANISIEDNQPKLNKSRRLEFGVERVLDNNSSVEATVFFDAVSGRGVGLANVPIEFLNNDGNFVANQQGKASGLRVVYSRRLSKMFTASAGYAIGNGQKLSVGNITNPNQIFDNAVFQTFVGQFNANLGNGTKVKTIFRLSPDATVFAIDPFQGRLAIYDPSLSVLITQPLPNLGLPFRAEATLDARNLFDIQTNSKGEMSIRLNSQQRIIRGGIMVRF
jgi:Carboxypeptidase regulatory-like domain